MQTTLTTSKSPFKLKTNHLMLYKTHAYVRMWDGQAQKRPTRGKYQQTYGSIHLFP